MAQLAAFGKEIKKRLVNEDRLQCWLIDEVAQKTGLYFDRSYMTKIQTGKFSTPSIVNAINEILDLPEQDMQPIPKTNIWPGDRGVNQVLDSGSKVKQVRTKIKGGYPEAKGRRG